MNMARAPVVRAFNPTPGSGQVVSEHGDDLAQQVRNARHVVEQDKRVVHGQNTAGPLKAGRRSNSSSSSASRDSGKKKSGFDHLSTIQSQAHHVDVDSQEGRVTQSEYVRHLPTRTVVGTTHP